MACVIIVLSSWSTSIAWSQQPLLGTQALFQVVQIPEVQADLDITASQLDAIKKLYLDRQVFFQAELGSAVEVPPEERIERAKEFKKRLAEFDEKAAAILLPFQHQRAVQLALQVKYLRKSDTFGLLHKDVVAELQLNPKQLDRARVVTDAHIKRVAARVEEMKKELLKMRAEGLDEIMSELDDDQRKHYDKLFGKFVPVSNPFADHR
jgi:hypothetical protein